MHRLPFAFLLLVALVAPSAASAAFDADARVERSAATGAVRFVGMPPGEADVGGRATRSAGTATAAGRAYLEANASPFGLSGSTIAVEGAEELADGRSAVRYQQVVDGVEVLGGQFVVQLTPGRRIRSVMGEAVPAAPDVDTQPAVTADAARAAAIASVAKDERVPRTTLDASAPVRRVWDDRIMGGPGTGVPKLVWETVVTDTAGAIAERVFVDAQRGFEVATISEHHEAKNRTVCDSANDVAKAVAPYAPCTAPVRSEGGAATGQADVDNAYDFAGDTYDFLQTLGRDSLDGGGLPLRSTVRYCPKVDACPYENAFWDSTAKQMVYGEGFTADDIVGHELAHGVTEYTSNLFYYYQSGAINESISDVFGELVDQANDAVLDAPNKWLLGEDSPFGAIRDMKNPPALGDPDRMGSPIYTDLAEDSGGVHRNSGVSNKAAVLIADGGAFNGRSITGVGNAKLGQLFYRVGTAYLTSASDFADLGTALTQACSDLVASAGFTAADCAAVADAVAATEMGANRRGLVDAPACASPAPSRISFFDDLEASGQLDRWKPRANLGTAAWYLGSDTPYGGLVYADSGVDQLFGDNLDVVNDAAVEQVTPVLIRPGARLVFRHAYGFEASTNGLVKYDGGRVEYTTGTGDAAGWSPLPGVTYSGSISSVDGNPLAGKAAFVGQSRGYVTSATSLTSLAAQSVRFRFRIASDNAGWGDGWHIDDISVRVCDGAPPQTDVTGGPADGASLPAGTQPQYAFGADESDVTFECSVDGGPFSGCSSPFSPSALGTGRHAVEVRATDYVGNVDPTPATRSYVIDGPPAPPLPPPSTVLPAGIVTPPPTLAPGRWAVAGKPSRRGRTVTFVLTAPAAGRLGVRGTARVKRGRKTRTVRLGSASTTAPRTGRATVKLTLSRAAVALLRTRSLRGSFVATFAPVTGRAQTLTIPLTLARTKKG